MAFHKAIKFAAVAFAVLTALTASSSVANRDGEFDHIRFHSSEGSFTVCPSESEIILSSSDNGNHSFKLKDGEKIFDVEICKRTDLSQDRILIITGSKEDRYGNSFSSLSFDKKNGISEEFRTSMENMNPHNIQTCDIDGNGSNEISITMYKSTRFHPVMDYRPYIYFWNEDGIFPMWRGSRLSRPFCEYVFSDIDFDKADELVSIEYLQDGSNVINAYEWKGFGFESIGTTKKLDWPACFDRQPCSSSSSSNEVLIENSAGNIKKTLVFSDGKLSLSDNSKPNNQ